VDEREELERGGPVLRAYLHTRMDQIEVSDLASYLARPGRGPRRVAQTTRFSLAIGGTALLLVAALIVGMEFRLSRLPPAASPTASPPPFGLSSKYGIVALTRDGFLIRSETDPAPIRRIEPTSHRYSDTVAVSHSGRYVAYWRPNANGGIAPDELMLLDAATNAEPRSLLLLTGPGEIGAALGWADDDSGIAFATLRGEGPPPARMSLAVVEVRDGQVVGGARYLLATTDAQTQIKPLAWIRETRTISAIEGTIAGVATNYVMAGEDGWLKRFAVSSGDQVVRFGDVMADSQTRTLAYLVTFTCQDGTPGCTLVRFWTLEDPQQALGWQANPGTTFVRLLWRPFTRDLLVVTRSNGDRSLSLQVWSSPHFGSSRAIPLSRTDASLVVSRPDGGAIFVGQFDGAFDGSWRANLIALDESAGSPVAANLTPAGGGAPALSVGLDSSETARVSALPRVAPLLSEAEIVAQLQKSVTFPDRIDQIHATLDRGSFPAAGRVATWTIKATGDFQQNLHFGIDGPPRPAHCAIWTFNARTSQLTGIRMTDAAGNCS
jgi:hypothetical protein